MVPSFSFLMLCIGCLVAIANGFLANNPPNEMKKTIIGSTGIPIGRRLDSSGGRLLPSYYNKGPQQQQRFRGSLGAAAANKENPGTSNNNNSDKVNEMAAYLSAQLLQKVMTEAMKPEGESNMDVDVLQRLTDALQRSNERLAESETETAPSPTKEVINEEVNIVQDDVDEDEFDLLLDEPEVPTEPNVSTPTSETAETKSDEKGAPRADTIVADEDGHNNKPIKMPDETSNEAQIIASIAEDSVCEDAAPPDNKPVKDDDPPIEMNTATTEEFPTETVKADDDDDDETIAPPVAKSAPATPKVFCRPLEVVQSDIPPLRPESIPRKQ